MPVVAIVGAQWGDEGKGKIVDLLAEKADMVVRFSGGNNAGHTVMNAQGDFKLHLIPAGVFNPKVICVMGNGMVIHPPALLEEIRALEERGVDLNPGERLCISDRAHLIMPYHLLLDELEETARGARAIGTTKKGIGPAYMDKTGRMGIRVGDLLDPVAFRERLEYVLSYKNAVLTKLYDASPFSTDEVFEEYSRYGEQLAPFVRQTELTIQAAIEKDALIIMEGAQGALLDTDLGTYPYVTSSAPVAAGSALGAGISPCKIDSVIGVFKCYTTRVGSGPFPSELHDEIGDHIREKAREYGTTTGRPRRIGWFDAVIGRFSSLINGYTSVALTRLDMLDELSTIKICTAYTLNGTTLTHLPSSSADLFNCQPVYEEMPGWLSSTRDHRNFDDLPGEAQNYVKALEELINCSIDLIAVGPRREESIFRRPLP
ncbi:MAG: adenylosuccinate synthase [Chloroflexi bacterium]|nr:adenylosuccinate synthase [Chloroflexota bacterium]